MELIYDMLGKLKEYPEVYLGEKSISKLSSFVDGVQYCLGKMEKDRDASFRGFSDFVNIYYYKQIGPMGWGSTILKNIQDESKAVDVFYELLDEYVKSDFEFKAGFFRTIECEETIYKHVPVTIIHHTNHGKPDDYTNPHEHNIYKTEDNVEEFESFLREYEKIELLYRSLNEIRKRPGMYLGEPSISKMSTFIDGFLYCQQQIDKGYVTSFDGFNDFVSIHFYGKTSHLGWKDCILSNVIDEKRALEVFYELLDEYLKDIKCEGFYPFRIEIIYDAIPVKIIHTTNHGNPSRFTNPHEHNVTCFSDNKSYYFLKMFSEFDNNYEELYRYWRIIGKFRSIEEFEYCIKKGGEVEFTYNQKTYSITFPDGIICLTYVDEESEKIFDNIDELMKTHIEGKSLRELSTIIEIYYRGF